MDNKKIIIAAVIIILVMASAAFFLRQKRGIAPGNALTPSYSIGNGQYYNGPSTKSAVPANVVVPNATSAVPPGVAKPQDVAPAAPGVSARYRSFNLNIKNGEYSPSSIIVNQGDTVHINFIAVDGNYDFTQPDYGLHLVIPQGSTRTAEFQAVESGKFTFFCFSCGGPAKGPVGYLIVVAR